MPAGRAMMGMLATMAKFSSCIRAAQPTFSTDSCMGCAAALLLLMRVLSIELHCCNYSALRDADLVRDPCVGTGGLVDYLLPENLHVNSVQIHTSQRASNQSGHAFHL